MTTYREIIYLVLDLLKVSGDDSYYTEEHVAFLLDKFRVLLLENKYSNNTKEISSSNYQTVCVPLEMKEVDNGSPCLGTYLTSSNKIPKLSSLGSVRVFSKNKFSNVEITYVSEERFKYVGFNKWLKNIIYVTEDNDYLIFKSNNPQHQYLESVQLEGVFESPKDAQNLQCDCNNDSTNSNSSSDCNFLDDEFPLEEGLIIPLIELTLKELYPAIIKPQDDINNANDDMSDLHTFIAKHAKSALSKQLEDLPDNTSTAQ